MINVEKNIKIWQGDITRLKVDAIVNAANSEMLDTADSTCGMLSGRIKAAIIPLKRISDEQSHGVRVRQI